MVSNQNIQNTKRNRSVVLDESLRKLSGSWDVNSVRNTKSGVLVSFNTAQQGRKIKTLFCRKKNSDYLILNEWIDTTDGNDLHVNSFADKNVKNGRAYRYKIVRDFGNNIYDCSNTVTAYYLSQPKNVTVTSKHRGKAKVSWKKNNKADGYTVFISTSKHMRQCVRKKVSSKNSTHKYLSNLVPGKTYYVQVASYKKAGDKTYYSARSIVREIVIAE